MVQLKHQDTNHIETTVQLVQQNNLHTQKLNKQIYTMPIKNMPLHLRPREKARAQGIDSLNDIELIALFLRSGLEGKDVLQIAQSIFHNYQNLFELSQATQSDLLKIKGIGKTKALELASIFEVCKRINYPNSYTLKIKTHHEAAIFAQSKILNDEQESFLLIILDNSYKMKFHKIIFKGQVDSMQIEPKIIMSNVLKYESKKFYCIHNHPSGDHRPSSADKLFTKRLEYYSDLFDLELLGHIIVSKNGYSLIKE